MSKRMESGIAGKGEVVRVLHVLGSLGRGGIEIWLFNILRHSDRDRLRMDFVVHSAYPDDLIEEIRALGSTVIRCPVATRPWSYPRRLRAVLNRYGPYHAVHSHTHHFSGLVLRVAASCKVPIRIAHSHSVPDVSPGLPRWAYRKLMKHWISRYATVGLAASAEAGCNLFGRSWGSDERWRVLFCGIDLTPFAEAQAAAEPGLRSELGLPESSFVLGHVGRFVRSKNHEFLLSILACAASQMADVRMLLVGDGPLRSSMERRAAELGVRDRVIFAGSRNDVARLMTNAMDLFVFPSLREGLGLALVEAQAAGLQAVVSTSVPVEAEVIEGAVCRLALTQPVDHWVNQIRAIREGRASATLSHALESVIASPFNVAQSADELDQLYSCKKRQSEWRERGGQS